MLKAILIGVVLLGFAWSYPPARERIAGVLEPVLERLGPVGEKILEPTRKTSTRTELAFILRMIKEDTNVGHQPPDPRNFDEWLQMKIRSGRHGKDPWASSYYMVRTRSTLTVGSPGPDRVRNTPDDLVDSMQL